MVGSLCSEVLTDLLLEVLVKRFVALLMLAGGLLMASGANAVPITWTIPATTLSGTGNSISGTFVYDANTNTTSSINLTSTISGTTTTLTYAGSNAGGYVRFQGAAVAVVSSTPSAYLLSTGLTNAGGSVTISVNDLGNGLCNGASGGICISAGFTGTNSSSVTVTGVAVAPIPSLSEWTQLLLALMTIMLVGWHFHRERSY